MKTIFHITKKEKWKEAKTIGEYRFCALDSSGFIHCSTKTQYARIASGIFRNQKELVLLEIDESKVTSEIIYENLEGGTENFPHIYGPLNVDAVVQVHPFNPLEDGSFETLD